MNSNQQDTTWISLQEAMENLYRNMDDMTTGEYANLKTMVSNHCLSSPFDRNNSLLLYNNIHTWLEKYTTHAIENCGTYSGPLLIDIYIEEWNRFQQASKLINELCSSINSILRTETGEDNRPHTIWTIANIIWREFVLSELGQRLTSAIIKMINRDRMSHTVVNLKVVLAIGSFIDLDNNIRIDSTSTPIHPKVISVYEEYFEPQCLESTMIFYQKEALDWLTINPVPMYSELAYLRIQEEEVRSKNYVSSTTMPKIIQICKTVFIKDHLFMLNQHCKYILSTNNVKEMGQIYNLVAMYDETFVNLTSYIDQHVSLHIGITVASLEKTLGNKGEIDPTVFGETVLDLYRQFDADKLVTLHPFKTHFGNFINYNKFTALSTTNKKDAAYYLALYYDKLLRTGTNEVTRKKLKEVSAGLVSIIGFLDDKDMFIENFNRLMSYRLIDYKTTTNHENEHHMTEALDSGCGHFNKFKMRGMLKDIELATELNNQLKKFLANEKCQRICLDIDILFLSASIWSFPRGFNFKTPPEVDRVISICSKFYTQNHSDRKLEWIPSASKGEIETNYFGKKYTISAPAHYIVIMLLFNDHDSYTITEVMDRTNLSYELVSEAVSTLVQVNLFLVVADEKNIERSTTICLNKKFEYKQTHIAIRIPAATILNHNESSVRKEVEADHKNLLKAAIVRIMKTRKESPRQELFNEVSVKVSSRFIPSLEMIQNCLDSLIEGGYMKRSEKSTEKYTYIE